MNAVVVRDSATVYTRVSKAKAVRLLAEGKSIALCPVRLRPGLPFASHCTVPAPTPERMQETGNAQTVAEYLAYVAKWFVWYNCSQCPTETGRYAAYYQTEEIPH